MRLFGWTMKQWGLAIGQMKRIPKTLSEAGRLRRDYKIKYKDDPVENLTIIIKGDDPRPCNWEAATELFMLPQ